MLIRRVFMVVLFVLLCSQVFADGVMIPVERPNSDVIITNQLFHVKNHFVTVNINDQMCVTKVDQIFHNDSSIEREGLYIFPMPEGSAITKFSMYDAENEIVGRILDKKEARNIYESIVSQRKDPALLEYIGRNMFKARVYPIPANGDKRIRLNYSEVLKKSGETFRYIYSLSTERFSSKVLEDCKVEINIKSKDPIVNVYSPSHVIDVERITDNEVKAVYRVKNMKPDTDLEILYTVSNDDVGIDVITHKERGEDGYFMLMASPRVNLEHSKAMLKNVVFVIDRTGSMAGEKIDQAKDALKFCLNSLKEQDSFNLVIFNETPNTAFKSMRKASKQNIKEALDMVNSLDATGGTNINDALLTAIDQFKLYANSSNNYIIFLTDGLPTVGIQDTNKIFENAKDNNKYKVKLFSFGVGYDVNAQFLDKLSSQNRGDADYVRPNQSIESVVSSFFAKVSDPVLADVELKIDGVKTYDVLPMGQLPDIFKGTQLLVFGRYSGKGNVEISLNGISSGKKQSFKIKRNFPDANDENEFMPQIWASRKIGFLLDEIRLHSNQELIDEVVRLSKKYGIPTEFTSFLADERKFTVLGSEAAASKEARALAADAMKEDRGAYGVAQSGNNRTMKSQAQAPGMGGIAASPLDMSAATSKGTVAANQRAGGVYRDSNDNLVIVNNVQNIAKRTFYQRGEFWEDSGLSQNQRFVKIKQFSEAHFKLMDKFPKLAQYSTLGNVRVLLNNNQAVEIGAEGKEKLTDAEIKSLL